MLQPSLASSDAAAAALGAALRGELIDAAHPGYDAARRVYNGMIDRRPRWIARVADVADVIAAVNFARSAGITVAIRGGGHNGAGLGTCDDGLVIDLARMKGVHVDPDARTVRVEGGATWGDVDHAAHAFGLAVPSGIFSTTGVGGLTLGGGHGYLTRKYGLTIDNLIEADVVLADGRYVVASSDVHDDLFWALRGGGGNFGVVTSFLFRAHPVSNVHGGPTLWPADRGPEVMRFFRDFILKAPDEMYGWFGYIVVPPAPMFPENLHGKTMCVCVWCYLGAPEKADRMFAPIRATRPVFDHVGQLPFPALQSAFDALYPPGLHWYWKADFFREVSDEAIAAHRQYGPNLPTPMSTMHLYPIDGAPNRVGRTETAFSFRDAKFSQVIVAVDANSDNKDRMIDWARSYWDALHPYSAGGAYVNFMMDEGQDRVQATYRDNYERLVEVKNRYDPTNLFRVNQNIRPTV